MEKFLIIVEASVILFMAVLVLLACIVLFTSTNREAQTAPVYLIEQYMKEKLKEKDFKEVRRMKNLIKDKAKGYLVMLPDGYRKVGMSSMNDLYIDEKIIKE